MTVRVIGSCSLCGGDVVVPQVWYGVIPPKATCVRCGAFKAQRPVIPMEPNRGRERISRQQDPWLWRKRG